ncbi:structure-specific endonuclease subunit SLX4-like [Drosophila montana]|uniref:structure-specific endonuclease subunit SLX4-like n=1 Tax=Drosophila montana TaxID=40370 RepID=UPI00313D95FC
MPFLAPSQESFIDLTEEHDSPETTSRKSLFEQLIFPQSPTIEFDEDIDGLEQDLSGQAVDCEISDALYAKYAYQTARDKAVFDQSQLDSNCLNISTNGTANSNPTTATTSHVFKDSILSFSQLDSTRDAFQRSCSFTQSPGQIAQLEQSFKSPLTRRSNSFTDKSALAFSHSDASIDLTQDSGDEDNEEDNEGVLLSDEEINYSIWKADKTCREALDDSNSLPLTRIKSVPFFKTVEDLDAYLDASPTPSNKSCNSRSPNKSALSKERAEFGILDAAISQPFTLSQLQSPSTKACQVPIDWADASFLETPPEVPLKRYSSSCTHKFKELLNDISEPADELDDFDRLVFQNSNKDATIDTMPSGLDRLLLGEINAESLPQPAAAVEPPSPAKRATTWEQLELNGQVYEVRVCRTPKPDFVHLTDAELLQQLYNCGIKPLKRKQAVKLLEYIYNQTHPIMLPPAQQEPEQVTMPRSKSTPITARTGKSDIGRLRLASSDEAEPKADLKFRDASGSELLRFSQELPPALCDDFECFVLQTNVSKKTPQPLLPLHIAWHNLLCANPDLHETVLRYEPIDLQEIYLHLKQLGHRYEPKELKSFFDRRCIILRYELAPPQKQAQRHIRKPKSRRPYAKP